MEPDTTNLRDSQRKIEKIEKAVQRLPRIENLIGLVRGLTGQTKISYYILKDCYFSINTSPGSRELK